MAAEGGETTGQGDGASVSSVGSSTSPPPASEDLSGVSSVQGGARAKEAAAAHMSDPPAHTGSGRGARVNAPMGKWYERVEEKMGGAGKGLTCIHRYQYHCIYMFLLSKTKGTQTDCFKE